jgi:hypothetical protein
VRIVVLLISLLIVGGVNAMPAMNVYTINTSDKAEYRAWAKVSGPVIGKSIDAQVVGVCTPHAGAHEDNDLYVYVFNDSVASALYALPGNETVKAELSKLEVARVVRAREIFSLRKMQSALTLKEGEFHSFWNTLAKVKDTNAYVKALEAMEKVFHKNGFEDIGIQIFYGLSGDSSGMTMSSVVAPNAKRLGEAFDALQAPWAKGVYKMVSAKREVIRGIGGSCETVYVK